jgi:hypothetical protein
MPIRFRQGSMVGLDSSVLKSNDLSAGRSFCGLQRPAWAEASSVRAAGLGACSFPARFTINTRAIG